MIGSLSQYGKLGIVCVGSDSHSVDNIYRRTVDVLNEETNCEYLSLQSGGGIQM